MLKRDELYSIHQSMKNKFEEMKDIYKDVRDFIYPYFGRFDDENPNTSNRHDEYFLKTTPISYANVFASGLQSGITSPTKKWFKLKVSDDQLMRDSQVRTWLAQVEQIVYDMLYKGHFYQENYQNNLELGLVGTSAMMISSDAKTGIRCYGFTCGEYYLDSNQYNEIDTFSRKFKVTAKQLCEIFDDRVPEDIKAERKNPSSHRYYTVYQLILPNQYYEPRSKNNQRFPYAEYIWTDADEKLVLMSGYHEFPIIVSRWFVKPNSLYGYGAGIWSVRSARELQLVQKNIMQMAELTANPPLQAPSDIMANGGVNLLPSRVNYYNPVGGSSGMITPILDGRSFQIEQVMIHRQELEEEMKLHFHYDVFKLISDMDKGTRTAREIVELNAEKMGQLGALLDRIETEVLPSILRRVLSIGFRSNLFPQAPDSIQGAELSVEFESQLSQAQRQSDITPIIDTLTTAINIASTAQIPEVLDTIDFDEAIDSIATLNGINPRILKPRDQVMKIRQQRAQQQQMLMEQQTQMNEAEMAKTASQAKMDEPSALTQVLGGAVPNALESY